MMNKAIATATLALTSLTGLAVTTDTVAAEAPAARVCPDSNGARRGGSVYISYNTTHYICDVVPPQVLHITQTPSLAACEDMGGRGWTKAFKICFHVDF